MWRQLIETALLGTEKKPLNPEILPDEIHDIYMNLANADPECKFLETCMLGSYYLKTGTLPQKISGEINTEIIEEEYSVAPDDLDGVMKKIDEVHGRLREGLYNLWLDLLIKKQFIIQPKSLVALLYAGNHYSEGTKSKIMKVIGNKGNWILSFDNTFRYNETVAGIKSWTEGNTVERKAYFTDLVRANSLEAINILNQDWAQESVVNKRMFLEIISDHNSPVFLSFATDLFKNEFFYKSKEKKTERECRRILAEILLGQPRSELYQSTVKSLSQYISKDKKKSILGLLSSKEQTGFELPKDEDANFWNSGYMERTVGFEPKTYDISLFQNINQYWLSGLIEILPMNAWIECGMGTISEILSCFLDKDEYKMKISGELKPVFMDAFLKNAIRFMDRELAVELMARIPATKAIPMLKVLPKEEFEQYIRKNKFYGDPEILQNGPFGPGEIWSLSFSEYIISNIFDLFRQQSTRNFGELGLVVARHIHIGVLNSFNKYHARAESENHFYLWKQNIYEPVSKTMEIRKMLESFS